MEKIAIIGLGYVGLPLAVAFAERYETIGFDISSSRVAELGKHTDSTLEVSAAELQAATHLHFSTDPANIADCTVYIVTVPTPIDQYNQPNLTPLRSASQTIGGVLRSGDLVVYESTVYPGATEEICVPILAEESGLAYNRDFFVGYSPERINPGDKKHTIRDIQKVVSGSTEETANRVDGLYRSIIKAGTYRTSSLRVAEAAKVIENTQRDINIAFINELYMLFDRMGIDTAEVLKAAGTKWNFLPFTPGLVGGHCIGVDPYYLTHKAQAAGFHPEMILAGRRINDTMGSYYTSQFIKMMIKKGHRIQNSRVLVMGITFKENCPDIRNSRVIDIVQELRDYECRVDIYDPWASAEEVKREYGLGLTLNCEAADYDGVIIAVAHRQFTEIDFGKLPDSVAVLDIKGVRKPKQ